MLQQEHIALLVLVEAKIKNSILSTDELIQAIRNDISVASQRLEEEEMKKYISKFEEYIRTKQ